MSYNEYIQFLNAVLKMANVKPRPRPPMKTDNMKL